uniref:SFRICE_020507 n=1 Tax=Spodoptera frugiperda TaxID=7108 RepID=A0A2H1VVN8_SPOFR
MKYTRYISKTSQQVIPLRALPRTRALRNSDFDSGTPEYYPYNQSIPHKSVVNDQFYSSIDVWSANCDRKLGKKEREYITLLEDKLEELQRGNRKTCIELKNVPKSHNESSDDLVNMVLNLSKNIGLEMESRDIKDIYRLPTKKEGVTNTPIIVETSSTMLKTNLLKKAKSYNIKNKTKLQAKQLGLTNNTEAPVFISEQLTPKGARLFFLARDLSNTKQYKYCWTSYGRVLVKKDDNSSAIVIKSEAQVHHLLQSA